MKKVFIAGHNGFVGSNLYNRLKRYRDYDVCVRTRSELDLSDQLSVDEYFKTKQGFDEVYICSAKVGGIQANINDPYGFLFENIQMQNNLINACIKYKVKRVLFLGSSCIYPKDYQQPLKEEYLLNAPLEPTNEGYSLAKIVGLKLCEYANKQTDTDFVSVMPCNLYGPGDNFDLEKSHVLSALIKKFVDAKDNNTDKVVIWGTGKAKREFLYIDDLIDAMLWSMDNIDKTETFLNVGTGIDMSILDLAMLICHTIGYKGKVVLDKTKPDGMLKKCLDVSKINRMGWKHKTDLNDGILKSIEYYRGLKND
jgi:GDP-L-fucose synthase